MAIDEFKRYHGFAIAELLDNRFSNEDRSVINFPIARLNRAANYVYVIDDNCALYFKYSRASRSPWQFSFTDTHIGEINKILSFEEVDTIFLVLICGFEAIAVLDYAELFEVLDLEESIPQSIRITTHHNRSLRISGSKAKLKRTLPKTKPFDKVYEYLESKNT